jgi:GNAT superfamily N-acetyltransferase
VSPDPGAPSGSHREISVTHFEMRSRVPLQVTRPFRTGMLVRLLEPTVSFYRYLLDTVSRGRMWPEVRALADTEISDLLDGESRSVTVLSIGGVPAGFFELDARGGEVALERIGLVPEFTGRGLGRFLLAAAVEAAWDLDPEVVVTETSELDDPRSLLLLQWAGFIPVGSETRVVPG